MPPRWTVDGDETSWGAWAEGMAVASPSPLVEELLGGRRAAEGAWALDLGCGTGRAFRSLAKCGYRVIGSDPTMQAVRYARRRAEEYGLPAQVLCATADRLPLREEGVQFVLAMGVLFHLTDGELGRALGEIRRVLQPDGETLLHFLDVEDWRRSLGVPTPPEKLPYLSYKAVVTCFRSEAEIREMIEGAGLLIEEIKLEVRADAQGERRNWLASCKKPSEHQGLINSGYPTD